MRKAPIDSLLGLGLLLGMGGLLTTGTPAVASASVAEEAQTECMPCQDGIGGGGESHKHDPNLCCTGPGCFWAPLTVGDGWYDNTCLFAHGAHC